MGGREGMAEARRNQYVEQSSAADEAWYWPKCILCAG